MKIHCPHCRQTLDVPEKLSEQEVKCPICRKRFFIQVICSVCNTLNSLALSCDNCGEALTQAPMISIFPYKPPWKFQPATIIKRLLFLLSLSVFALLSLLNPFKGNVPLYQGIIIGGMLTTLGMLVYSVLVFCNVIPDSKNLVRLTRNAVICFVGMSFIFICIVWSNEPKENDTKISAQKSPGFLGGSKKKQWDKEAYRIFMALQPHRESIIDCIVVIDDWNRNIQSYTSRINDSMPIPSDEVMLPFKRYKLAMNYLSQKIMDVAPEYVKKDKKSGNIEVEEEIFIRVIRLCGSKTY